MLILRKNEIKTVKIPKGYENRQMIIYFCSQKHTLEAHPCTHTRVQTQRERERERERGRRVLGLSLVTPTFTAKLPPEGPRS